MKFFQGTHYGEEKQEKNSSRVVDYYQPDPLARHRRDKKVKERMADLPHFYGKDNVDIFLNWKMKVEQPFDG